MNIYIVSRTELNDHWEIETTTAFVSDDVSVAKTFCENSSTKEAQVGNPASYMVSEMQLNATGASEVWTLQPDHSWKAGGF